MISGLIAKKEVNRNLQKRTNLNTKMPAAQTIDTVVVLNKNRYK